MNPSFQYIPTFKNLTSVKDLGFDDSSTACNSDNNQGVLRGDKRSVEKNYAPCTIPNGPSDARDLHQSRKERIAALYYDKEKSRTALMAKANHAAAAAVVNAAKQEKRDHYAKRVEEREPLYIKYDPPPVNCSPLLNMLIGDTGPRDQEDRVFAYNKKRHCPHGNRFNVVIKHYHQYAVDNTSDKLTWLELACDCKHVMRTTAIADKVGCGNCTARTLYKIIDHASPVEASYCKHCRFPWYTTIGSSRIKPIHLTKGSDPIIVHRQQQLFKAFDWTVSHSANGDYLKSSPIVEDLQHWPRVEEQSGVWSKPTPLVAEQSGLYEGMVTAIQALFMKIKGVALAVRSYLADQFSAITTKVTNKLYDLGFTSVILGAWDMIAQLLEAIVDVISKRPLTFICNLWTLLTTENSLQRVLVLTAILMESGLSNLWNRLVDKLGCHNLMIGSWQGISNKVRQFNREKRSDREKNAESTDDEEVYEYTGRMRPQTWLRPEVGEENGSSFFSLLFGFTHWLPKTAAVLNHLKDFNTLMSSWRNLHELVNNLLTYLPTWFTKLFTITDPRKRFGVEAKTRGNPVFDMVESYLSLLRGENCASPRAYEEFQRCWRAADLYVNEEYPPNEQVLRMVKHYFTSANAIMRPGTHGSKPIPQVITIFGVPGTGKSSTWPLLLSGIIPGDIDDIWEASYTRYATAAFFDGYAPEKHKVFIYDDFGSQVDDEAAGEIMSIVSNADFLPPFGSLSDPNVGIKGTSFASPIVVLCSNFKEFTQCKQIADKTALQRRLGVVIHWNEQLDIEQPHRQKYRVDRAGVDGKLHACMKDDGTNFYTLRELQKFLADDYVDHYAKQSQLSEKFNKLLYHSHVKTTEGGTYLDIYNSCKKVRRERQPVARPSAEAFHDAIPVQEQMGTLGTAFGFFGILTMTYALSDYIDDKYRMVGDAFLIAAGAFAAAMATCYFFFGRPTTQPQSGENGVAKAPTRVPFVRAAMQSSGVIEESGFQDDANISRMMQNSVVIVNEKGLFTNGLFLKGRILLINKHFLDLSDTYTVHTHRAVDTAVFEFELKDTVSVMMPNTDLALILCPMQVSPFPDVLRKVINEPLTKRETIGFVSRRQRDMSLIMHETKIKAMRIEVEAISHNGSKSIRHSDITYSLRHQRGDCGNLIFAESGGSSCIVGLHAYGDLSNPDMSYGVALNRGELEEGIAKLCPKELQRATYARDTEFVHEGPVQFEDGVGLCNKNMFVTMCTKPIHAPGNTTLIPSLIHDQVQPHVTSPAVLRISKKHDPLMKDLTKYSVSTKQYNEDHVQLAVHSIATELISYIESNEPLRRPLSLHEALNGIPGIVESVDLSTSSGYPFSLDPKLRGPKRNVILGEPGNLTLGPEANAEYQRWIKLLDEDTVPNDPFIVTLKDERRSNQKVQDGLTRVFCAGGLVSFLINKMYFGGFCAFFKRTRGKTFSTLGMDRSSTEWNDMIRRELEVGPYCLDGDHKGWDGRAKSAAFMALARVFDYFYDTWLEHPDSKRRYILMLHSVFCYLRITWNHPLDFSETYTILIETIGAMPSGWFLTFVLNSLLNALMMRVAWLGIVAAPFNDLYYFRKYTRDKYAGDDSRVAVAQAFIETFNNVNLAEFFARYDQIYTPATKGGELVSHKRVQDASFLKQTTGVLYDRYVPLFELQACLETTNWIRKCDDHQEATESNCNDVLRNLFFYGRETFDFYRSKMQTAAPWANLISFAPLASSFLEIGKVVDPTGAFTYSKTMRRDPTALYREVERLIAARSNIAIASEEAGTIADSLDLTTMSSDSLSHSQPVAPQTTQTTATTGTPANIDDSQPVVTAKMGVTLSEQQQVVIKKPVDGNAYRADTNTYRAEAHLNETDWDLEKMLLRENLVGAFPWSLTDVAGSELSISGTGSAPTDVPQDLLKNDIVAAPFMRFQWMRFEECLVRLQITASRFHQGRLLAYFVPTMIPKASLGAAAIYGPTRATQVQHLFLDPANGFVGEMSLPFRYHKGFIDLVFGDVLGQLRVQVLNPLQAATGASTSVEVKVFVSFKNAMFKVPRPGGTSFETLMAMARRTGLEVVKKGDLDETKALKEQLAKLKRHTQKLTAEKNELDREVSQLRRRVSTSDMSDVIVVEEQSGTFASLGKGVGGEIDKIVESVLPREVTGAIAGVLMDKPAVTEFPEVLAHKDAQYMTPYRGVEKLERMTGEPSAQNLTADQFGTPLDEMDMKYLLKKPTYLTTFNWSSTQTVGTILYQTINSPTHYQDITLFGSVPKEPTPLTALGNLFTFWRGGFVLLFQVIGTAFHEGRLDFCNHPALTIPPSDYPTALSQYVNSQTIRNTNNTVEVRVPFHSDTPWKRVWFGESLSDTEAEGHVRSMDYVTGCFSVRVAVPLKNPNNVANNVDVNVFVCAADDFQFHTVSIIGGILQPFLPARLLEEIKKKKNGRPVKAIKVQEQAGDLNTDTKDDKGVIVLGVGNVYTFDPPVHHFGETFASLREMCKRYWTSQSFSFTLSPGNENLGKYTFTSATMGGLAGYLSQAYRLFRGPMNFKAQLEASEQGYAACNVTGFITNNPQPPLESTGSLAGIANCMTPNNAFLDCRTPPLVRFSDRQIGEFQVPFQSMYHSLLMDQPTYDLTAQYYLNQQFQMDLPFAIWTQGSDINAYLSFSLAFADETRFGVFMGFPSMIHPTTTSYPNPGS